MFVIYEITPTEGHDYHRYITARDIKEDAEIILEALERTNILFDTYVIKEVI